MAVPVAEDCNLVWDSVFVMTIWVYKMGRLIIEHISTRCPTRAGIESPGIQPVAIDKGNRKSLVDPRLVTAVEISAELAIERVNTASDFRALCLLFQISPELDICLPAVCLPSRYSLQSLTISKIGIRHASIMFQPPFAECRQVKGIAFSPESHPLTAFRPCVSRRIGRRD